jgi:hypothetical protein
VATRRISIPSFACLPTHRSRRLLTVASGLAIAMLVGFVGTRPAEAATGPVGMGTAASFAVLAGSTITNTGASRISGSAGVSPGSAVVGFPPGLVFNGKIHRADAVARRAKSDLTTAYNDAAGRSTTSTVLPELGGRTLVSGVYTGTTLEVTGTLTLNARGNPNAVFVFKSASTLVTAPGSRIRLINGASPCNVYFQVGSSTTLGSNSVFVGTVMAQASITAVTGATIAGRLLARTGAVTLDRNTITRPGCGTAAASTPSGAGTPGVAGAAVPVRSGARFTG